MSGWTGEPAIRRRARWLERGSFPVCAEGPAQRGCPASGASVRRLRDIFASILLWLIGCNGLAFSGVVINEVMYNSIEDVDVEFVELYNSGPSAVDLTGWYLLDDNVTHQRCYLTGSLPVGGYLVVPGYLERFTPKYPQASCLNANQFDGVTGWGLGNSGDQVRLYNASGVLVDFVSYSDQLPWPTAPDGNGPSLELKNPTLDNNAASSWGGSNYPPHEGTPCARNDSYAEDQVPIISDVQRDIPLPTASSTVRITARVTDDVGLVSVRLLVDAGSGFSPRSMYDDGLHGDGYPLDAVFGADPVAAHPNGTLVRYYVEATDTLSQVSVSPALAPADYYAYTVGRRLPSLIVNELVAVNQTGITDEVGQFEDWVEVRNLEPVPLDIGGMFLADDMEKSRLWSFPSPTLLEPGERLLVWCDNDASQGPYHALFKLNRGGGLVALFDTIDNGNVAIHVLRFGPSAPDVSFGFFPETADAPEYLATPTPGASNDSATLFSLVVINEFLSTSSAGGLDDWIELYNRGAVSVDVSGWQIADDINPSNVYTFPAGVNIPPGGFLSVDETSLGFGIASDGSEVIVLASADGATGQDFFDAGPQSPDVSQGRLPNGEAFWRFFVAPSRNFANACPDVPPSLPRVTDLRAARGAGVVRLSWTPLFGVSAYDLVRGDLSVLRASGGDFAMAAIDCVERHSTDAFAWDDIGGPSSFFLVRAASWRCEQGSYDDGTEYAGDSRDDEIAASGGACP